MSCSYVYSTESRVHTGVAARLDLCKGQLVEEAHCILIPRDEYNEHMRCHKHFTKSPRGLSLLLLGAMHQACSTENKCDWHDHIV